MRIRNSVKGIIIDGGKILLNKSKNILGHVHHGIPQGMIYYELPGGGQEQYESLEEALGRECLEETGYTARPQRLLAII